MIAPNATWCEERPTSGITLRELRAVRRKLQVLRVVGRLVFLMELSVLAICLRFVLVQAGQWVHYLWSLFGPNMGSHIALVGPDRKVTLCRWSYSYPEDEYGLGQRARRYPINSLASGNARHVKFGQEAGIHFSQLLGWPGNVSDDDPRLDAMPSTMRWDLLYDCLVARSPVGIRVGRGINHAVIVEPFSVENAQPMSDAGRQPLLVHPTNQPAENALPTKHRRYADYVKLERPKRGTFAESAGLEEQQ